MIEKVGNGGSVTMLSPPTRGGVDSGRRPVTARDNIVTMRMAQTMCC
jgi:hypothetical protein